MRSVRDWTANLHSKDNQRRGRVVGAETEWQDGIRACSVSLDREVGQRLDGNPPEASERKAITSMEMGDSLGPIQACSDP